MSDVDSRQKPAHWWQWSLVPVAAIAGGVSGAYLFRLLGQLSLSFGGFPNDGWMQSYILPLYVAGTFGWLVVWISYHVAPARKQTTATTVNWLLIVIYALNVFFVLLLFTEPAAKAMLESLAGCFGSLMALSQIRKKTLRD